MVDDDRSKATPGSHSWVRKFTLSCSRCRAAKLKCDRKEPCVSAHVIHARAIDSPLTLEAYNPLTGGMCQA